MKIDPVIISANELNVHFGEQVILEEASLSIHDGDRIGLIGRNGAGKSTFLKIISKCMMPDSGEVTYRKDLTVGYLPQDFELDYSKNVYDNILEGASTTLELISEYESLAYDSPKRILLEEKIKQVDGWNIENLIKTIMVSLNCPDKDKELRTLSGGELRRVSICRALTSKPDILILDEPTNHLDTASIEWTEEFLASYSGACLFVTHDRYFLDRIANRIVELYEGQFYSYKGNYTAYLLAKAERTALKESNEKKRQSFIRKELEWVRRGPKARTSKSKSRLDKYFETESQKGYEKEADVDFLIPPADRLSNKVLDLYDIKMELDGKLLFEALNLKFKAGTKLGIIGKNGTGKTSLLKIILGDLKPNKGNIDLGENTKFNYIDQNRLQLNDDETVFETIAEGRDYVLFGEQKVNVWTYLKRFLFTEERINTKVGQLSGGEKGRLTIAKILKEGGNFIILDEPTNDLDLPTLRVLEEALMEFAGCVIVVSHDRYFLNRVCNEILAFEDDGKLVLSEGDYDYYIEKKKANEKVVEKTVVKKEKVEVKANRPRKLKWKEERELEVIEEQIEEAEVKVSEIESIFSAPDFYEKYADKTEELNSQFEEAKKYVSKLYTRWDELEDIKNNYEAGIKK
ncbi:MAG: ATP-binding cassette domain-containing protein [Melioribacteraceae bacterium]|nr:ATP-binding cassette domain-containing protein [Melioribacteraceae bacterium]